MFDKASMLLCDCFVRASGRDLQLDSELLRLFIRFMQVTLLGCSCIHHNDKHDVADLESRCIQTQTMDETHAELHCQCRPNPGEQTGQQQRDAWGATLPLQPKPGRQTGEQWRDHSVSSKSD